MKKIFTLITLAGVCGFSSFGQSQRMTFLEEFTQASCGPCASQNPALNALLANNTSKVISLKYQTSWPGVDPMNAQNPTQVATRVTYYGVNGVPNIEYDGNVLSNAAPSALTQSGIDNRYAVASPFDMSLSHTMSADYDSIFITCTITCSQAVSTTLSNGMKAHIALVEEEITFATPPGSNGETDFYSVMRKMLPSDQGTTLPDSWTVGQTQTITISAPVPTYIYNLNELGVVAFIQDNANKSVHQSALSQPQQLASYAGVTAVTSIPTYQCSNTITPTITIKNLGTSNLTSATINYVIDNGTPSTMPWTGNLAPNGTTTVTLPSITVTNGAHTFSSYITNPNGVGIAPSAATTATKMFSIYLTGAAAPLVEGYTSTTFPPASWFVNNPDNGATWVRKTNAGGFGNSTSCAKMDFYYSTSGNVDELYAPSMDLSASGFTAATLNFNIAYAQYSATAPENDRLEILVSTDCGTTWSSVYDKAGDNMKTANPTTSSFTPTSSQWRAETVSLTNYVGQSNLLLKFKATSDYGNNMYIDDINLFIGYVGVDDVASVKNVELYPNPAASNATLAITSDESVSATIVVYDAMGRMVMTLDQVEITAGKNEINLNTASLADGVYTVKVTAGSQMTLRYLTVAR
jgi:hypothetical protein